MSDEETTTPGRILTPNGMPATDVNARNLEVAKTLATQRQRVEEAKFAILVEVVQAIEELSDTVWAVAGQLMPSGKGRKARLEFETLQTLRAQKHEAEDQATIDKIREG